jgi:hypothetical protein
VSAGTYQRPREKNPSSRSTSTTMRMIQRIDTEKPSFVGWRRKRNVTCPPTVTADPA